MLLLNIFTLLERVLERHIGRKHAKAPLGLLSLR